MARAVFPQMQAQGGGGSYCNIVGAAARNPHAAYLPGASPTPGSSTSRKASPTAAHRHTFWSPPCRRRRPRPALGQPHRAAGGRREGRPWRRSVRRPSHYPLKSDPPTPEDIADLVSLPRIGARLVHHGHVHHRRRRRNARRVPVNPLSMRAYLTNLTCVICCHTTLWAPPPDGPGRNVQFRRFRQGSRRSRDGRKAVRREPLLPGHRGGSSRAVPQAGHRRNRQHHHGPIHRTAARIRVRRDGAPKKRRRKQSRC